MAQCTCLFNGCETLTTHESKKCNFHRNRAKCSVPDCTNQVYARHLCIRHGGKRLCRYPNCYTNARAGDLCAKHGGAKIKPLCFVAGCDKKVYGNNKCIAHGGGKSCCVSQCSTRARTGGYCWRHRNLVPNSPIQQDPQESLISIIDELMAQEIPDQGQRITPEESIWV
ncbi:hypothetical protein THRCLA_20058 [Thraustotheca clavata]|uniref:Uncharacterized protein n=1 Tax=Thraustotheca clavata TaxID=74557 RepID=A0A1W0ACC2_9STRA|nr:hypothetical protein THRCLA_20058 [Thraustotheca clavata]